MIRSSGGVTWNSTLDPRNTDAFIDLFNPCRWRIGNMKPVCCLCGKCAGVRTLSSMRAGVSEGAARRRAMRGLKRLNLKAPITPMPGSNGVCDGSHEFLRE